MGNSGWHWSSDFNISFEPDKEYINRAELCLKLKARLLSNLVIIYVGVISEEKERQILTQYVKYGTEINAKSKWVLRLQQRFMS